MQNYHKSNDETSILTEPEEHIELANEGIPAPPEEIATNYTANTEQRSDSEHMQNEIPETTSERFEDLFYLAPVAYVVLNRDAIITEVNREADKLLKLGRAELLHSNFRRFIAQQSLIDFEEFFWTVFTSESNPVAEFSMLIRDADIVVYAQACISKENNCLLTLFDITQRKQSEQKIQFMATRYRRMFESAKDGLLIMDADTCQVVDVNPCLLTMLGSSHDDLLGQTLWDFDAFRANDAIKDAFIELQVSGYVRLDDVHLETKNGSYINVEIVSSVYMVENKKMIQCDIRDITERKKTESALKESVAKLREVNNNKDKFFSIISHDLRRPFSCIIGYSNLLAEYVHEKKYDKIEEYAAIVQNSSWRAMDLLINLIEWSQSQMGRIPFNPANIEFSTIINEVADLSKDFARQKSISISWEIPNNLKFFADRAMICIVLRNIISNAIKFTDPGGSVVVSARLMPDELMVSVKDTGVGMSEEAISKLFQPEERYSTTGTQKEMGSGLGLLLSKEFVEKHGGRIWIESTLCQGSEFFFTIPSI